MYQSCGIASLYDLDLRNSMDEFIIDSDLEPSTQLYRYVSLETFFSFIESQQISLTNISLWDDRWEAILSRIPTVNGQGRIAAPSYSFHQFIYGQSWSRIQESDAMWRIYSPTRTGLQIATSVEKFKLVGGTRRWHLGSVTYFETIADLLEKGNAPSDSPFRHALLKRMAFSHEREVRFLTHGDFLARFEPEQSHIGLQVDLTAFIEGVTIDPRADDWYVDAIARYCARAGLSIKPVRSSLYEPDPHLKVGLVRSWVPKN